MEINEKIKAQILKSQVNEITEYLFYRKLASWARPQNKETLEKIAEQEFSHYHFWQKYSKEEVQPNQFKIFFYSLLAKTIGLNFSLKLMEMGEDKAQDNYHGLEKFDPEIAKIAEEERKHEQAILMMLNKEELAYTGSVVLGLNDAMVELTGALAGFTLALQNPKIVALAGLITGIAASLSMAASEYLSTKEEENSQRSPFKASLITGLTYFAVVLCLVTPYFLLPNPLISLGIVLIFSLTVIALFNFYIAVAKNLSFKKKFLEMATISLGVAALNFLIGLLVRNYLKIEI